MISGQREAFIRVIWLKEPVREEIRQEEQSEKAESCWENLQNEIQLKGP